MTLRLGPLTLPDTSAGCRTTTASAVVLTFSLVLRFPSARAEVCTPADAWKLWPWRAPPWAAVAGAIVRTVAVSARVAPAATTETRVFFMGEIMRQATDG